MIKTLKTTVKQDREKFHTPRMHRRFEIIISMSKMFLMNKMTDYSIDNNDSFCFLFPTDQLFEGFIGGFIKETLQEYNANVYLQKNDNYVLREIRYGDFISGPAFNMRLDILIELGSKVFVLDTKYKEIERFEDCDDIFQLITNHTQSGDLYQVCTYAVRNGLTDAYLLYPMYRFEEEEKIYPVGPFPTEAGDIMVDNLKDLLAEHGDAVSINELEALSLIQNAEYYNEYVDLAENRFSWFQESMKKLNGSALVFLDPDNGVCGIRKRPEHPDKYIVSYEIEEYFSQGKNVVYYCHKGRRTAGAWEKYKVLMRDEMHQDCKLLAVTFHKGTQRTFVFVLHKRDYKRYRAYLEEFVSIWGDWVTMEPILLQEEAEEYAAEFDSSIDKISTIILKFGGYGCGFPEYTARIGDSVIIDTEYQFDIKEPDRKEMDRDEFFKKLKSLHIGSWKKSYDNWMVLDGYNWQLKVEFNDGRKPFESSGSNACPGSLNKLENLLKAK